MDTNHPLIVETVDEADNGADDDNYEVDVSEFTQPTLEEARSMPEVEHSRGENESEDDE